MNERLKELLERLVAPGSFPNMSCSEGHELYSMVHECCEGKTLDALRNRKVIDLLLTGSFAMSAVYDNSEKLQQMNQSGWASFIVSETTKKALDAVGQDITQS